MMADPQPMDELKFKAQLSCKVYTPQVDKKPIVCYSCYEVGHKSPQCTKKKKGTVKRIEIHVVRVKSLNANEVIAEISGVRIRTYLSQ